MSQILIRKALEKRLASASPAIAIASENTAYVPVDGTPYAKANLLPGTPDNTVQGASQFLQIGVFQVTLCYPLNTGVRAAETQAELLRTHFKRGTSMTESGVTVVVMTTPNIAPALIEGDRYCIPVSVTYQSQIST